MRSFRKRLLSLILILLAGAAVLIPVRLSPVLEMKVEEEDEGSVRPFDGKTTLILWYTDEALTDYLNREAVEYGKTSGDTRVLPVLVSGLGLLESALESSIDGTDYPDLYITTHDNLEKAALAGIASEVEHAEDVLRGDSFPEAALNSVTWHGLKIAYPFYGETVALLYNRTYLEDEAKLLAEEAGKAAPEGEELDECVRSYLPEKIADLLSFAGHYNAPDEVEAVFSFDVNDLFTDYFFAGDAIDVGGPAGDDSDQVSLYNERVLTCMDIYQQLGQFFAVDAGSVNEEKVLQDFVDGKTVFTIATMEAVQQLKQARDSGECAFVFGAAPLPSLTEDIGTRALSVTNCVVVNGFSEHMAEANRFATFLTGNATADLYVRANKMPAAY
ncbi:MAG: extracellular solute-binding protein, partial [Lachnospiraceae bacterium]|nr:extracellular solute-binding protein [Lachnospiraceae bacterium]